MNNFTKYITPEQALKLDQGTKNGRRKTLSYYQKGSMNNSQCENCSEKVWKYGGTGLCFSCTTGEADASEDYELKEG